MEQVLVLYGEVLQSVRGWARPPDNREHFTTTFYHPPTNPEAKLTVPPGDGNITIPAAV
jgi:hypothetical protein